MIFSIIVPVCNGQDFLKEAVDSALCQKVHTGDSFEIILVENGSTDNTPRICDEYAASHDNVSVIHEGRIGLYQARQEGIKISKGDYILALDADDKLKEDLLETLGDVIRGYAGPDDLTKAPDLIFYNAADMDKPGSKLRDFPFEEGRLYSGADKKAFKELVIKGDKLNAMWIKCIRKDIAFIDNRIEGLNYGEDLYQTAEYVDRATGIAYIDKVLYLYRKSGVSLTASYNKAFLDNQKIVWRKVDELTAKWQEDDSPLNERKALTCAIAAVRIVYSALSVMDKKAKLKELFKDAFYKKYSRFDLPEWAPIEDINMHEKAIGGGAGAIIKLLAEAVKHDIKAAVKKRI
ncbi:glycosyltransferase family 2 protein [Butyrivibrio sp. XB500-5]|uniref:glycosyltransferase family 2 protein n=1 Tax=Butyrivibrio sp. XB500-5 TaxID=2364880 RepID=UPI000EA9C1A5|nr:glycosyltransferase [Butyrivibrio sp. XB500-5]RKM59617.1 glycosyltransferase family 2 protein [Butyrivibrio sp. XB500-5]